MKKICAAIIFAAFTMALQAQSWELKVNAGGNTTFVNNIWGNITTAQFIPIIPGLYDLKNSLHSPTITVLGTKNVNELNKIGFYADAELVRHLGKNWSISVSAGINKTNYSYNIAFPTLSGIDSASMKSIDKNFGDTKLIYISSRFLNITKSFSNLSLTGGPVLNFLVRDNGRGKAYYRDNSDNTVSYITSPLYKPAKFLYGGSLALGYKLAKPLELKAGVQYFFNSVYKKGENKDMEEKDVKVNPFQITLGLSYSLTKF